MPQAVVAAQAFIYGAVGTTAAAAGASSATAAAIATGAVTVATATAKVALLAGLNAVVANQNKPRPQGGMITLTVNPDEPRRLQVGKRLNAGVLVDWYVGAERNQHLFMVVYLGEGPMGQVTKVFGGGRAVYSTPLVHGTRTAIPDYRSGGDRLWITYYDGRPGQTADSYLVGRGLGWNSNCIGTGCAYAIIEAHWDSDNMTSPPQIAFEIEGAKFYDRRKDTTAGGSGSHRIDSPSTWELSDNPAVALDHYLRGRYLGSVKTFGIGVDADDLPYDRFAALANLCDEDVDLKAGSTQKRYRANGFLFADRTYGDTIKDLCRAMNARPADFGGRLGVIDGEERTPVLTLTDGDVFGGVEQYSPKRSWADLVSEVRGTYQSPSQNYQAMEYPRVSDAAWVTADGGSPREATVDFEMETDPERAQRLAWLFAMRERRQAQLTGTYALRAIELEQGDWFVRSGGIFGEGKTFEVIDRALNIETMTVTLTAFEVDPADTAWDETTAADAPPDPVSSTDTLQAMEVPDLTVTGVTLSGAVAQLPAIKVEWPAPDDPRVRQIVIEAVPQAGGTPTAQVVDAATEEAVFTSGITDDTDYYVRARFIGTFIPSEWTSTISVTTTGDYAVGEATSVPWSGVTGAGKPADNATVGARAGTNLYRTDGTTVMTQTEVRTAEGTAAAIAGQDWGATASEAAASNALVPKGTNLAVNGTFAEGTTGWTQTFAGGAGVVVTDAANAYIGDKYFYTTATPATGARQVNAARIAVTPGEYIRISATAKLMSGTTGQVLVRAVWRNAALSALSGTNGTAWTNESTYTPKSQVALVPASAVWMDIEVLILGPVDRRWAIGYVFFERLTRAGTNLIDSAGNILGDAAIITASGTAAAIAGQGWGATASETEASNQWAPRGENLALNGNFALGQVGWLLSGGTVSNRVVIGDAANAYVGNNYLLTPDQDAASDNLNSVTINVVPGDYFRLVAAVKRTVAGTAGTVQARLRFTNGSGALVSADGQSWSTEDSYTLKSRIIVVPAGAVQANITFLKNATTGGRRWACGMFFVERLTKSGENLIDSAGNILGDAAIITASGTAAAITGQGSLATQNQATWSTQVTGTGKPDDNADVTGSNTAAAIIGQGWGATASETMASNANISQRGILSARPASGNFTGQLYYATDTGQLFEWDSSAWTLRADVTAKSQLTITPTTQSVTINCNSAGTVISGQLPRTVGIALKLGDTVVSADAAWSIVSSGGATVSVDDTATSAAGNLTVTALPNDADIVVAATYGGVTLRTTISFKRNVAPPPITGSAGGTSASDTSVDDPNSTSYVVVTDELTVLTGSAGEVELVTNVGYQQNGLATRRLTGRWQQDIGGTWTDVGTEVDGTLSNTVTDSETGSELATPGALTMDQTITGLTASTSYKFRLRTKWNSTPTSPSVWGTASATGS